MIALLILLVLPVINPAVTPGLTRPEITKSIACTTRWGLDRRLVTEKMKRTVAESYGLKRSQVVGQSRGPCCEFDHLIPRSLGGADDIRNLWPQPWKEAKRKDVLEVKLGRLVCAGTISLVDAQHAIATDWTKAYRQYVIKKDPK